MACTIVVFAVTIMFPITVWPQNAPEHEDVSGSAGEGEVAVIPEASEIKLTPVFPDSEEGLIYIEGEDAVSTNFSTAAVYNYGASSYRSLQLIQQNAPYGGQSYYAEYAFFVEEEGEYDFWYGGTPSGPREDVYPSYASPFRYVLDDQIPVTVYREDQSVVEAYTPSYYWNAVGKITLTEGVHTLRFEISEKRRYDGQYYFFLDAFFFLRSDRIEDELTLVPELFPRNRTDRSIDNPFQSISHYENVIKENPGNKNAYIVLSMVYSLLGDNINAIKNLNSAINLDKEDPYPLLLMAKNRIWNGEISAGLNLYRQLVTLAPDNPAYWAEAGKVAAWTGKYRESIDFFTRGLEVFPEDLNLKVNLGLTYLWMAKSDDARKIFEEAASSVRDNHERVMELGSIHEVNGYPRNAVEIYADEISRSPEYLDTYLALEQSYRNTGEPDKASLVIDLIYDSFEESPEFSRYMSVYEEKVQMKQKILDSYRKALAENPDNISLRQELAQTYFWNGLKKEAVDESLRILVNKMFLVFRDFDNKAENLLTFRDSLAYVEKQFLQLRDVYETDAQELKSLYAAYGKAEAAVQKKPDDPELPARVEELSFSVSDSYSRMERHNKELDVIKTRLDELTSSWDALFSEEEREEELFRQLLGDLDWSWDRNFTKGELRKVQRDEPYLANYILGRLAMVEGQNETAVRYLNQDIFEDAPFARYGLYQSWLWSGDEESRSAMWSREADVLTLYRQHLFDLEAAERDDAMDAAPFGIPQEEEVNGLLDRAAVEAVQFEQYSRTLKTLAAENLAGLDRKLNRSIYSLEQETYMLRYELGDYYLEMGENLNASLQYDRVLAMDPWNISANYKLGVVSQRYGNWYRAMEQYKKVYYQNPLYENAASYYNQLARAHADTVHITALNVTDPSRISHEAHADYKREINGRLAWGFAYQMDVDSMYRTYGDEDPSSFKLQTLGLIFPVTFPGWNLTVTPLGGFHLFNRFFGSDYDFNPDLPVSLEDNRTASSLVPRGGVDFHWEKDFLRMLLAYRSSLEEESLFAGRNLTRSRVFDLTASTYFPLESSYEWGPVTTRTYGSLRFLDSQGVSDVNRTHQVVQEASVGYVVSEKPYFKLTGSGLFNYEDSLDSDVTDYYAPQDVFELKGGLRGSLGFHNSSWTENLEISLYGSGGAYWAEGNDPALKVEGLFSLYYVKDSLMLYLITGANGTFPDGAGQDPEFWEVSATLGCKVNVPSLLVP